MKQLESRAVTVGDNTFYIRPFPAFKAANISGQLATLITPAIGGLLPLLQSVGGDKKLMDMNLEDAAPAISGAFSSLSGDKLEYLLRELLVVNKNVSVDDPNTGKTVLLTEDTVNEIFCTDVQDMYLLAFEVIKISFGGFFEKLGSRFGSALDALMNKMAPSTENTAS